MEKFEERTSLVDTTGPCSVTQLTQSIQQLLEGNFAHVWVEGEISNFKQQSSGHLYFSLKDAGAQISAVMFRGNASRLIKPPKDGDHVALIGQINVYPPHGKYQIVVRELQFVGLGQLLLRLHQLKQELERRGWFAVQHKKSLPRFPKTIGVVTSPTGAVIRDIINVLTRRFYGFHLILNPVKVQGDGAAEEIALAIQQFNTHRLADVLIVGRGGGSIEDLWAFNEEIVASAIFHSEIPIISAVGHETDTCIADFVADVRAPTPSAAAEIVIGEKEQHLKSLRDTRQRLRQLVRHLIQIDRQRLDDLQERLDTLMRRLLHTRKLHLEALRRNTTALKPTTQLLQMQRRLTDFQTRLQTFWRHILDRKGERLKHISEKLAAVDPRNVLKKGYCVLFAEKKTSVIVSANQLHPKQTVVALLSDGEAALSVESVQTASK